MIKSLTYLFIRELERLKDEVVAYKNDVSFWKTSGEISNSGGNLSLHLIGNLNHFIGHGIGKTAYLRDRENEFKSKNISRKVIIQQIDDLKIVIESIFTALSPEDLQKKYPKELRNEDITVEKFLLHLYAHFNYHLGQINYHRRLVDYC